MRIHYKNRLLERVLIGINTAVAAGVVASYVCLFGFRQPLLPAAVLYAVQIALLAVFIAEKIVRFFNSVSKREFW
ncbi:MAG: hypothetical protein KAI59_02105, partial [Planctomycetes bacterium]|nr:hypothetical protein [Planctomycetota bacterium]